MVEPAHHRLSISAHCRLLRVSRPSYYYAPVPETRQDAGTDDGDPRDLHGCPWYGSRQIARHLRRVSPRVGHCRARRLMAKMSLVPQHVASGSDAPARQSGGFTTDVRWKQRLGGLIIGFVYVSA